MALPAGRAAPVLGDCVVADVRLPEGMGVVDGVSGEESEDRVRVRLLQRPRVPRQPVVERSQRRRSSL